MLTVLRSTKNTTRRIATQMVASANCSAAPEKRSYCEPLTVQPSLFGDNSKTTALTSAPENSRTASTARPSGTKGRTRVHSSFVKRMRLLIASGLIGGITPTSTRKGSSQRTLATAFYALGGADAE